MPYNNTPIAPTDEVTGTASLPLARVKKIIAVDPDISACSNNAAFCITVATELFLRHLVEHSFHQVKAENTQKPRRNIQYRDVANAVARVENLEFLSDVVPRTMTYKQFKQKQAAKPEPANGAGAAQQNGQGTLDGHLGAKEAQATNGADVMDVDDEPEKPAPAQRVPETSGDSPQVVVGRNEAEMEQ